MKAPASASARVCARELHGSKPCWCNAPGRPSERKTATTRRSFSGCKADVARKKPFAPSPLLCHRHLPHAQGRNHSPGPRLRLFRPASSRNQGEAVGKPDRQAWLRSHLAAHRQGGLKCKKERRKNQCLNVLFLFSTPTHQPSPASADCICLRRRLRVGKLESGPLAFVRICLRARPGTLGT